MASINPAKRDQNHVPGLVATDELTSAPFAVQGTATDGSINVNVVAGGSGSNVNLVQVSGASIALGQTTMSASLPVTIANNQSTLPVGIIGTTSYTTGQETIATTATQIVGSRATRRSVTIVNLTTTDIFIGGATVTTSTGQLLLGVRGTAITLEVVGAVYGIVASGTHDVSFEEEY